MLTDVCFALAGSPVSVQRNRAFISSQGVLNRLDRHAGKGIRVHRHHRSRIIGMSAAESGQTGSNAAATVTWTKETRTVQCSDTKNREWTFGSDVYRSSAGGSAGKGQIVCIHTATGLGVNRTYWNPFFRYLCSGAAGKELTGYDVHRFDWICTGDSSPKPDSVSGPFTVEDYVLQLEAYVRKVKAESGQRIALVAQGGCEPVALVFADRFPELMHSLLLVSGISAQYLEKEQREGRRKLVFSILNSPAGNLFWNLVTTRKYIEGFSRKNLICDEHVLPEWVDLAYEGAQDRRVRFGVFSFISGYLFGDYRRSMSNIKAPVFFISGDQTPEFNLETRMASARPPVGLVAKEATFRENRDKRIKFHHEHVSNMQTIVVPGVGVEISFERPDLMASVLDKALSSIQNTSRV